MKRSPILLAILSLLATSAFSQTIDKPVATLRLTKLEVVSLLQFKSDVEKVQAVIGRALTATERKQFLETKINTLLFFQYCDRENIYASEAEINAAIAQAKASLGGMDDTRFAQYLRSQGVFVDAKIYFKQQILFHSYLQAKRQADLKALKAPTSDDVLKAYELAKASLVRPDTMRVSVIYVDFRGLSADAKAKSSDALRQLAAKIKADPTKFDEYVIKSTDPGALYKANPSVYVSRTQQYQDAYGSVFMDKVFGMKVGDISDLIENQNGIQLVRINEFLPQKQLTLSDQVPGQQATVQDILERQLAAETQQKLVAAIEDDLVASLRKEASVKIYDDNLNF
ncbi:MAG TPA: peptidyl-prolyl cis-trans isomerase [Rectinemataceae bacterium]|nr:peptidyl-prolyl cis-trans isomerase [Rectinemataceae bacterium]